MSEPQAAFLRLRINRGDLIRWLDSPIPSAASWSDWRNIGGSWGGLGNLKEASDDELRKQISQCDASLARHKNRVILDVLLQSAVPHQRCVAFDAGRSEFVAGSLLCWKNLSVLIMFFTLTRGAANFFKPNDYGITVAHDYTSAPGSESKTQAALSLGPGATSEFMSDAGKASAAGAFQAIADAMMANPPPTPVDDLKSLR